MSPPLARALPLILVGLGLAACGPPAAKPGIPPNQVDGPGKSMDPAHVAQALARRGDYLTASRYWEAALFSGAAERRVLPPLIVCEVRAGRLRAALANVRRLAVIAPEHPAVEELETLISGALASGPGSPRDEVRR